jgi:ferredoxin
VARPLWFVELIKKAFPQRFLVARMTRIPGIKQIFDKWLFEGDDIIFLTKDNVIQINANIQEPEQMVLPSQVVEHFINEASYHWIMRKCICRDASRCRKYPIDLGCIFLGKAALQINPELGRRVTKQEALEHARKCREAGLVHMIGRNKLDAVWLNVRPGKKLLTICNCCECCCLWRVLPQIAPDISAKIHRMPGVTVTVNDLCTGCGECADGVCFADSIHIKEGKAVITDACRGCGRCLTVCPSEAIEISFENEGFEKDMVERLSQLVDLS